MLGNEEKCSNCNKTVYIESHTLCYTCYMAARGYTTCNKKGCDNIIKNPKYKTCFDCNNKKYKCY